MKSKLLQLRKVLLVAVGLLVVASAWADAGDVTTNADIDFSNAIEGTSVKGNVGSMTWTNQWSPLPSIENGYLKFGNWDGAVVELQNNSIESRDVVTIKFELAFGKLTNKHVGIEFKDINGEQILLQYFDAYNGDFDDCNPLNLDWNSMYRGSNTFIWERRVYFTIKMDYAANTITTNTSCYLSGTGKAATNGEYVAALPSITPIGAFVLHGNINNADRMHAFDNLLITTTKGNYDVETANYAVKWVEGESVVKEETREGEVDSQINLLPTDIANFFVDDVKYIVTGNDAEGKTIAADGTTTVTISVRKAEKWAYTVTSSYDGKTLGWNTTGEVWEDETNVTISYPRYQASETLLVEKKPNGNDLLQAIVVTNNGFTTDFEYAATGINDLYFLSEAEDLNTGLAQSSTTYTNRVSSGKIIYGGEGELFKLPAGKYIVTLGVIGGDQTAHIVKYTVSAGERQIAEFTCDGNFFTEGVSEEFAAEKEIAITFTCSDPASTRGIDLVYVQKTGDIESVSATIGTTGYATFASDLALDFKNATGVIAYYATAAEGNKVTMKKVEGTVAAGQGLFLQKDGDEAISIPVVATGDELDNLLVRGEGKAVFAEPGFNKYVLGAEEDGKSVAFYLIGDVAAEVDTDKAYLQVPATDGEARLSIVFEGETTGINEAVVNGAQQAVGTYNLNGQRVAQPTKGLYIVNGKKVIIK